jgi:hypothetical protein
VLIFGERGRSIGGVGLGNKFFFGAWILMM